MAPRRALVGATVALLVSACAPAGPSVVDESPPTSEAGVVTTEPAPTSVAPDTAQDGTVVARATGPEVTAYQEPDEASPPVASLANPIASGGALVFRVLSPAAAAAEPWLEVMLPVRPNGTTGWIQADQVDLSLNPYRIVIDTSDHRLDLYRGPDLTLSTDIAVGTGDTPTPYGDFYLAELLQPPDPGGAYGPYAFGLSGYSEVLDTFNGGNGVVGIHGTNEPAALGTDVSHGCVRVLNDVIEEMADRVPLGTPVLITV
ncbi:MAG: L,D-transpeptidase family protein [Acidimicrobiales bacterium]